MNLPESITVPLERVWLRAYWATQKQVLRDRKKADEAGMTLADYRAQKARQKAERATQRLLKASRHAN